mmetsp:Transcript_22565/g.45433  ORF Transcript_22565/g.45433 Transcript_22565/m.45433 type:complete len:200 (-) Transcript_22565:647-1246(-)
MCLTCTCYSSCCRILPFRSQQNKLDRCLVHCRLSCRRYTSSRSRRLHCFHCSDHRCRSCSFHSDHRWQSNYSSQVRHPHQRVADSKHSFLDFRHNSLHRHLLGCTDWQHPNLRRMSFHYKPFEKSLSWPQKRTHCCTCNTMVSCQMPFRPCTSCTRYQGRGLAQRLFHLHCTLARRTVLRHCWSRNQFVGSRICRQLGC